MVVLVCWTWDELETHPGWTLPLGGLGSSTSPERWHARQIRSSSSFHIYLSSIEFSPTFKPLQLISAHVALYWGSYFPNFPSWATFRRGWNLKCSLWLMRGNISDSMLSLALICEANTIFTHFFCSRGTMSFPFLTEVLSKVYKPVFFSQTFCTCPVEDHVALSCDVSKEEEVQQTYDLIVQ